MSIKPVEMAKNMGLAAWSSLIDGIAARLRSHEAAPHFLPLLTALRGRNGISAAAPSAGPRPDRLPVQRYWPAAGAGDPLGQLMAALDAALSAPWRQNPNYRAQPPSAGFLDNYGYLECAGPEAPVRFSDLRLGLLLLGPQTLYPTHRHPAEEVYLPLGSGRWQRGAEDWCDVPAGAIIHHPPLCDHATRSGTDPLAAIYLWCGEIGPAARIG